MRQALSRAVPSSSMRGWAACSSRRGIWGLAPSEGDDLTIPLDVTSPLPAFVGTTPTKITKLSNGLTVASSDVDSPAATVGVYIDTGSASDIVSGTAHVLQHMAFKSSEAYSHLGVVRAGERMGAFASAVAGRENMVFQIDTMKSEIPEAMAILADTLTAPKMLPWEVDAQMGTIKLEIEEATKNPQQLLQDFSHAAAFGSKSPLGQPLSCPKKNLKLITPDDLKSFVAEQYCASRMVVAGAGCDHEELVSLAEASFGNVPAGTPQSRPEAVYTGGEYREAADEELCHFALSFKSAGWKDASLVPLCVLNTMMGGGASFSAGGPGKGMYTRLYLNILNQNPHVHATSVFTAFYNDVGLFGVYGATTSDCMESLVGAVCHEMKKMGESISPVELSRAKNQLTSSLLMNLESRPVLFEDVGRQALTYGARTPPEELVAQIDAVTAEDVLGVAKAMLKTPPSVAVYGDVSSVPRYDQIAKFFA